FDGDDVKLSGVPVGKVTGIHIRDGRAEVSFEIDETVALPVDTVAAVHWRNLIGQRYVYLYPGTAADHLAGGDQVEATRSVV
ncbi:MlaD family protein, partial [Klebsiella pneumoniae]